MVDRLDLESSAPQQGVQVRFLSSAHGRYIYMKGSMIESSQGMYTGVETPPELQKIVAELLAIPGLWDAFSTLLETPLEDNAVLQRDEETGALNVKSVADNLVVPQAALHFMTYPFDTADLEQIAE